MRRLLLRLGLALVGLAAAVYAVEVGLRIADPHGISDSFNAERYRAELLEVVGEPRLYRHRPSQTLDLRGFSVHTDSRGCRGAERTIPKPAGVKRALFIGDSVTFGWGVDEEETFAELVPALLAARTGEAWEGVNLGHMGYDTTQELGAYDELGALYEPDLIILVFVDNDVVPMARVLTQQQADPRDDPAISPEARSVFRSLARINRVRPYLPYTSALASFYYIRSSPAGQVGSIQHAEELNIDVLEGEELSKQGLRALQARAREAGARFCVLDYFTYSMLMEFCQAAEIPYGSIVFTPEQTASGVRNSDFDAHANPEGHRILADNILRELLRLGLI